MGATSHHSTTESAVIKENDSWLNAPGESEPGAQSPVLAFVATFTRLLTTTTDFATMLEQSLAQIVAALPGSACACIYLQPDTNDQLTLAASYPRRDENGGISRYTLAAQVADYIKPITLMIRRAENASYSPILGVPVCNAGRTLGALIIEADERIYSDSDTELLTLVAAQLALAIENHQLRHIAQRGGGRSDYQ